MGKRGGGGSELPLQSLDDEKNPSTKNSPSSVKEGAASGKEGISTRLGKAPGKDHLGFGSELSEELSKKQVAVGLRFRFLADAAQRALRSETAWADVAEVAKAYHQSGDRETANYWLRRATRLAKVPSNPILSSRRLRAVIKVMGSLGEFHMAKNYLSAMAHAPEREMASVDLVKVVSQRKRFEEAHELIQSIHSPKLLANALQLVAEQEARHVNLDVALLSLGMIPEESARSAAYGKVSQTLAKQGRLDSAFFLARKIQDTKKRDQTLAQIAEIQSGKQKGADAALALIHDPFLRDSALRGIIESEADRRRINFADEAARKIKSPREQARAQEALVNLQVRHGELASALDRAQTISSEAARHRAIQSVAVAEVKENGLKAAHHTASLIRSEQVREVTFRKIAQRAAVVGKQGEAVATIHLIRSSSEKAKALASVALTNARYGDESQARHLARNASLELEQVTSRKVESQATGVLAEVYAETGEPETALNYAALIKDVKLRDQTYARLAVRFAKSKETDFAEQSAYRIERHASREKTLDSVARTLASQTAFSDAYKVANALNARRQQVRFLVALASRS